jgi:hypothetical protein
MAAAVSAVVLSSDLSGRRLASCAALSTTGGGGPPHDFGNPPLFTNIVPNLQYLQQRTGLGSLLEKGTTSLS